MATKKTPTKSAPARKPAAKTTKKTETKAPVKSKASASKAKAAVQHPETAKAYSEASGSHATAPSTTTKSSFKIKKSYLILAAILIVLAAALYFSRSWFVAAVVNGQPIPRLAVLQEAEKQSGNQVLTTLVRNALIEQEARKQNVTVTEKEIDDEIKKLEENLKKQGQQIDQVLEMQGMSKEDLRKLIRLDKMVGKMVGKDIKITDQQVAEYIEQNKEALPTGQNENELKNTVKEQLRQQQLNEKVRTWLEDLQKKAKINRFVNY